MLTAAAPLVFFGLVALAQIVARHLGARADARRIEALLRETNELVAGTSPARPGNDLPGFTLLDGEGQATRRDGTRAA